MKTFKIPVSWEEYGVVEIEAETLEQAIEIFDKTSDDISPPEGDYIDGSFQRDSVEVCEMFEELQQR